jgi:hypothetical protein
MAAWISRKHNLYEKRLSLKWPALTFMLLLDMVIDVVKVVSERVSERVGERERRG